jgi:hypothetical protein
MPDWVRRAGQGRAPDGSTVTWSVAEGSRGRRWREAVRVGDGIRSSLLLELAPNGRFSHLELSTAAGLLTLHPEPDGTLHGNTVTAVGVGHVVALPWDRDAVVLVDGSVVCQAAAMAGVLGIGATDALRIGPDLSLARTTAAIDPRVVTVDGLPALDGGTTWPLEEGG